MYYVITMIEDQVGIQSRLHGPYETGEEMEIAIEDKDLHSYDALQRLKAENNQLTEIEFFDARKEKKESSAWVDGPPIQDGYFWIQVDVNEEKFVGFIEDGKFLTVGSNINWELNRITKHQVVRRYED
jgi:hypothetical protein